MKMKADINMRERRCSDCGFLGTKQSCGCCMDNQGWPCRAVNGQIHTHPDIVASKCPQFRDRHGFRDQLVVLINKETQIDYDRYKFTGYLRVSAWTGKEWRNWKIARSNYATNMVKERGLKILAEMIEEDIYKELANRMREGYVELPILDLDDETGQWKEAGTEKIMIKYIGPHIREPDIERMESNKIESVVNITKCARCGNDHNDVPRYNITNPTGLMDYWAICPDTLEPIIIRNIGRYNA